MNGHDTVRWTVPYAEEYIHTMCPWLVPDLCRGITGGTIDFIGIIGIDTIQDNGIGRIRSSA